MTTPRVYLVGAGPGHPGYLTVRGVECLARADVVLYDKLAPRRLLDYAPSHAQRICVSELPDKHPDHYPAIHRFMIDAARAGKCVVRLKGGDPFIFGRGGEEAQALTDAGIVYEIVPGITAALGGAACAGIPLTHRSHASSVTFVTGHENPDKESSLVDWGLLARTPGTLAIYMGISRLGSIVRSLIQNEKDPSTPACAIQWAATGDQRVVEASLEKLPQAVQEAGLVAPSLIVIGSVVGIRPHLSWFERRPLFGRRVLVTRPRHQAAELVSRLDELGAVSCVLPLIRIDPPASWSEVDRAIADLAGFNWLVFTSINGVRAFLGRLLELGHDWRAMGRIRLAAIGPGTAEELRKHHLKADLVPAEFRSEALADALRKEVRGQRVLLARADRGRDVLRSQLAEVATVEQVSVYSQSDCAELDEEILDSLRRGEIDFVTVTSANIARAFGRALDDTSRARIDQGQIRVVSISPVTTAALQEEGIRPAAEAREYTIAGLVEALERLANPAENQRSSRDVSQAK